LLKCKCGQDLPEGAKFCLECGSRVEKLVVAPKVAETEKVKKITRVTDELPDILTAQHISDYLGISRRRVYELFQWKPEVGGIPNFDIGFSKRVDKQDFLNWIEARKQEKSKKLGAAG